MDKFEIQIFDEITNYKEKFGFFTLRQWLFVVLIGICVIPTYIFLPKLIGEDITSWIVLFEAALIGFIGFVQIHNLPAEKLIPYWIRHYWHFNKPLKYMSLKEYQELKDNKKNNKSKTSKPVIENNSNTKSKPISVTEKSTVMEQKNITKEQHPSNINNPPKDNKKLTKQEKALIKAKRKYGYLLKEDNTTMKSENDMQKNESIEKTTPENKDVVYEDKVIIKVDAEKELKEVVNNGAISPPVVDEKGKIEPLVIVEDTTVTEKQDEPTIVKENISQVTKETSDEEDLDSKLKSLSDEEKRLLLKLLGK